MKEPIYGIWAGDNPMNANRRRGWESFARTGLEPVLITPANLANFLDPRESLHPAYPLLSIMHRVDYLRAYLMFYHGGGYADIKEQTGSWAEQVAAVKRSPGLIAAGYREIRGGVGLPVANLVNGRPFLLGRPVPHWQALATTYAMRTARPMMMGNGAYFFKPRTPFARRWLDAIHARLDILHPLLKKNPAREIREHVGGPSGYPVPWGFLHGDVLSLMSMLYIGRIALTLPRPSFDNYA